MGQDLLGRLDILERDDRLRSSVLEYERLCPCPDMGEVERNLAGQPEELLPSLEIQVNRDLAFRDQVVRQLHLSLAQETFLFGRPLFQLLQALGVMVSESPQGLRLAVGKSSSAL
jgi:hypothetical protein